MFDPTNIENIAAEKGLRRIDPSHLKPEHGIGAGSYGNVCVAIETQRQQRVAVKTLKAEKLTTKIEQELLAEAEKMACIRDENIVDFYGICIDQEKGIYSLVLPYMENGSVRSFFERIGAINTHRPLQSVFNVPWCLKIRLLYQVASAITALHSHHILHIDLKASNVLLNEDLHAKVTDFGLSRWHDASNFRSVSDSSVKGTITHIPPEYFHNVKKTPNVKFDVYSYGILIWEILTSKHAYENCFNPAQVAHSVANQNIRPNIESIPTSPRTDYNHISKVVKPLMVECWSADENKRKTIAEVKATLDECYMQTKDKAREEVPKILKFLENHNSNRKNKQADEITEDLKRMRVKEKDMFNLDVQVNPETQATHKDHKQTSIEEDGSNPNEWRPADGSNVQVIHASGPVYIGRSVHHHSDHQQVHHKVKSETDEIEINENPDLKANNIIVSALKEEVSSKHLDQITRKLGKKYWRILGRDCLRFEDGELDAIEVDYHNVGLLEQIHQMFRQWKEKYAHKATREWLATSFVYINRLDLIDVLNKRTS